MMLVKVKMGGRLKIDEMTRQHERDVRNVQYLTDSRGLDFKRMKKWEDKKQYLKDKEEGENNEKIKNYEK